LSALTGARRRGNGAASVTAAHTGGHTLADPQPSGTNTITLEADAPGTGPDGGEANRPGQRRQITRQPPRPLPPPPARPPPAPAAMAGPAPSRRHVASPRPAPPPAAWSPTPLPFATRPARSPVRLPALPPPSAAKNSLTTALASCSPGPPPHGSAS